MFRGSVKSTGYPLHSPVSPSLPLPCVTVCNHISTGLYHLLWAIANCVSFTFPLRIIFRGHFYVSKTRTLHAPVTNGPLNMIKTPIKTKIRVLQAGPLTLSSKIRMCINLDLSTLRGDHTNGIHNNKVLANIVIPRLTKIIRSGITFVSRNVISRRFL